MNISVLILVFYYSRGMAFSLDRLDVDGVPPTQSNQPPDPQVRFLCTLFPLTVRFVMNFSIPLFAL